MRIEELTPELPVAFLVNINGNLLSFDSQIDEVYPKKHLVLAKAVYFNGKIVSFRGKNIIVDLLATFDNEKPQLFKNITVTTMKKPDNSLCYNLTTFAESKPYNRRENFRCYVGLPSVIQFGPNKSPYDTILRDVSATGFSVTCDDYMEISPNQVVHVLLHDYIEELNEHFSFHLYGLIVRSQELENGNIIYGCRLNNRVIGLDNYIMKKERIRLKNCNGGKL